MTDSKLDLTLASLRKEKIPGLRRHSARVSEADTIQKLIEPLLDALGWDTQDLDSYRREYPHRSGDNPVDCALFLRANPVLFVEAKALGRSLDDRKHLTQTLNYAHNANVRWCALTDGAEWRVYNVHAQEPAEKKLYFKVHIDKDGDHVEEAGAKLTLIGREGMEQGTIDQQWERWSVDRKVREVIKELCESGNTALVNAVKRQSAEFQPRQIRAALNRIAKDMHFSNTGNLAGKSEESVVSAASPAPVSAAQLANAPSGKSLPKEKPPGTEQMFERGLLKPGMRLRICGESGSEATVVDGKRVNFRGTEMGYNQWGQSVKNWKSIRIYAYAETVDGKLLNDLRDEALKGSTNNYLDSRSRK